VRHKVKSSAIVFTEFFKVEKAHLSWEKHDGTMGEEVERYVIRRGDSVGILPVCEDTGKIVLVKQFRYPACQKGSDGYLWEIPAGMVSKDEDPETTARRELSEEIGIEVQKLTHLISFFLSPGVLDEQFTLFYASLSSCSEIGSIGGNPYEHEDLLIKMFDKEKLLQMIERGEIVDAKTIASILYYLSRI
jgi:ADP-ribose pyrophosphatase